MYFLQCLAKVFLKPPLISIKPFKSPLGERAIKGMTPSYTGCTQISHNLFVILFSPRLFLVKALKSCSRRLLSTRKCQWPFYKRLRHHLKFFSSHPSLAQRLPILLVRTVWSTRRFYQRHHSSEILFWWVQTWILISDNLMIRTNFVDILRHIFIINEILNLGSDVSADSKLID